MLNTNTREDTCTHTRTHKQGKTHRHMYTHINTQGPSAEMPQTINYPPYRWGHTEAERSYHTPQGWAEESGTKQSADCCGRAVLPWTPAGETVAPGEGRASVDTQQ